MTTSRENLPALLTDWAAKLGDRRALTYLDHRADPDGVATSWTWRELDRKVGAVASWIGRRVCRQERVAVLAGQGLHYVAGFLGVLRAGAIAVPLFGPDMPGHTGRLSAVLADCRPTMVLTTTDQVEAVTAFVGPGIAVVAVDAIPDVDGADHAALDPNDVAYLQYTSGSTRTPAGVMVTHANVVANAQQGIEAYGLLPGRSCTVGWLPLYHDMGLVLSIAVPVTGGLRSVLMDPLAFVERPERWLRALSANPGSTSAAPNFAFLYCASRIGAEEKARLRLDHVVSLINGSEPVHPAAIAKFDEAFAECGLKPEAHRCSYGLAEATVLVSATPGGAPPSQTTFDRALLADGYAVPATEKGSTLVSCGHPADQLVRVVDPVTYEPKPAGSVGEVWVSGPNVGLGYWGRQHISAATFAATLSGESEGRWLRTGDLGVLFDGELYVTGRIKDLIIVDGRNHYPQDIEVTTEQAHAAIRPHNVAAFSVPGEVGEQLVVVAERRRSVSEHEFDLAEVQTAVRAAISTEHGLSATEVILVEPGGVCHTSSGKVSRSANRAKYLAGELS